MSSPGRLARIALLSAVFGLGTECTWAQVTGVRSARPNLVDNIERPLRYRPDGSDFVIVNGAETFNRPLYGGNTAFRVDGGDRPEFVMYLPGRGGNLRLGLRVGAMSKWLKDAAHITTRYRPGELLYEIRDPLLGEQGRLELHLLALHETDGLVLRVSFESASPPPGAIEFIAAFGGVNGERGARDGDIGTERVPISEWFQLQPAFCDDNRIALDRNGFELRSAAAHVAGIWPRGSRLLIGDARNWNDLVTLLSPPATAPGSPVVLGTFRLAPGQTNYLALQRIAGGAVSATELGTYRDVTAAAAPGAEAKQTWLPRYAPTELARVFAREQAHFRALRERVQVRTPDPYLDAAVGALNIAADAVWDEPQQAIMHGSVAWRARLLGWRGPYVMDALGWHDRARAHLRYWATRQNLGEIPARLPPAEEATNLARNPAGLHSNGDLSNSHYDMNLVYIDALFRHLLWTGDREFAREMWPVIERHLAWERRLFRREFGPQELPLYEAYAAIWASDDLSYNGGGATHASAYNYWHNRMAARIARLLGEDATPFETEAGLIQRAMNDFLWLPEQGMFAEYRDWLGLQRAHPAAALWSFYHVLDAGDLVDEKRAWQMTRYVDTQLPHLPVRGPGIEGRDHHVLATSNWMPYTWSTNNVVMGENMHAALGFWQAGRADEALLLMRSALLASMYMGISPGNVGTMNYLDVYRRESQRDFADGAGTTSRALVEGLFGIRPDALVGSLVIHPGWPARWRYAALRMPDFALEYRAAEDGDHYLVSATLPNIHRASMKLHLSRETLRDVRVDGRVVPHVVTRDALGRGWLEFGWSLAPRQEILVSWQGARVIENLAALDPAALDAAAGVPALVENAPVAPSVAGIPAPKFAPVDLSNYFNDRVTGLFRAGKYRAPRSPFVSLAMPAQGIGAWAGHVNAMAEIDDSGLRHVAAANGGKLLLPGGAPFVTPGEPDSRNIAFTSLWDNYPDKVDIPLAGKARQVLLLLAGSTNQMQSRFDNGEVVVEYRDGSHSTLPLHNPTNWWPIDQDYFIDDFQFRRPEDIPLRVDLKTGNVRSLAAATFKGVGGSVPGGAATVLALPLAPDRELRSLTVRALANEVVIGLMAVTLVR